MSLVLSRLHYCDSRKAGIPQKPVNKVQRVMNCAARLVCMAPRHEHVTLSPFLVDSLWFSVERRIDYNIATICCHVITCTAPPYFSDHLEIYIPSCTLRTCADNRIFRTKNYKELFFHWSLCQEKSPFLYATCSDFVFCCFFIILWETQYFGQEFTPERVVQNVLQGTAQDSLFLSLTLLLLTLPAYT